MKALLPAFAAGLLSLCACTSPDLSRRAPGPGYTGGAGPAADAGAAAASAAPDREAIRMPDRITLPSTYRLMLVDGHLALVLETDPQALAAGPTSMRIVMGEVARGELAYQPALLPQELAAQVASSRESSARMDNALDTVMRRSRELSDQAMELEAQGKKLAELLAAAQARVRELEAGPAAPPKAPAAKPDPVDPQN